MVDIKQVRKINAEMARVGATNVEIAQDEDVSAVYVSYVKTGKRKGYRVRQAIAKRVGKPVEVLWPDTPEKYRGVA